MIATGRRIAATFVVLAGIGAAAPALCPAATTPLALSPTDNPKGIEPLPAPVAGQPLFPRPHGHLPFGLSDTAWAEQSGGQRVMDATELGAVHAAMGATIIRMPLYWPQIEPTSGAREWEIYDAVYRDLIKSGVRPLWTIYQTPRHAVSFGDSLDCRGIYCDAEPAQGQNWRLTNLGRDLALRYPLAAGFELRNEPNHTPGTSIAPVIAPDRYTAELAALWRGVKAGRPEMRVFGGALSMESNVSQYLDTMLANGAASALDGLTFHPYSTTQQGFGDLFGRIATPLAARGLGQVRLVPDEFGMSTDPANTRHVTVSETVQRDSLLTQYRSLDTASTTVPMSGNVDAVILFTTVDGGDSTLYRGMGWLHRAVDGRFVPKSVFCAFGVEIGGLKSPFAGDAAVAACPGAHAAAVKKAKAKRKVKPKRKIRCKRGYRLKTVHGKKQCRRVRKRAAS